MQHEMNRSQSKAIVAESARSRQWKDLGPLTLTLLSERLQRQHPQLPVVTASNAREVCRLPETLNLQLCDLGSCDLLWLFTNLTELVISNNFLTQANALENLTKLRKLNMSYNQLTEFPPLSKRCKLEVLSLQGNLIAEVPDTALEGFQKLQVLNLSFNLIAGKHNIISLRRMESLRTLCLAGNPAVEDADSKQSLLAVALLPRLVYLDAKRIDTEKRALANEYFKDLLDEVAEKEENERANAARDEALGAAEASHARAGVSGLDAGSLFELLFADHALSKVLLRLPGADILVSRYKEQLSSVCCAVFAAGMQHAEQREQELQLLHAALQDAYQCADDAARSRVKSLDQRVVQDVDALHKILDDERNSTQDNQEGQSEVMVKAEALKDDTEAFLERETHILLSEEVVLADQVLNVLETAARELNQTASLFFSSARDRFQDARSYAYEFYKNLRALANRFASSPALLKIFKSPFDDTTPSANKTKDYSKEDADLELLACRVFEGEDTLSSSLSAMLDKHLDCIHQREQELDKHLKLWLEDNVQSLKGDEWKRHRRRLREINNLLDSRHRSLDDAFVSIVQLLNV